MDDETLFVLQLRGCLLGPMMARNALKSNVMWSSYPVLPPTGASGCLADLLGDERWYEGNAIALDARRLHEVPSYEGLYALGAYPRQWRMSRRHFRSHLGSIFNYEAVVWSPGRNEGKKLAVVEEMIADELSFVIAAATKESLLRLHANIRGRLTRLAKKGSYQFTYSAEPEIIKLKKGLATGDEQTIAVLFMTDMGSLPRRGLVDSPLIGYIPLRSRRTDRGMEWDIAPCIWEEGMRFRSGVPIWSGRFGGYPVGLSDGVWHRISADWDG